MEKRNANLNFNDYRNYYNDGWFTINSTKGLDLTKYYFINYPGYKEMYWPNSVSLKNGDSIHGNKIKQEIIFIEPSKYAYGVDEDGFELCDAFNLDRHDFYEETDMRSIFFKEVIPVEIKGPLEDYVKKVLEDY